MEYHKWWGKAGIQEGQIDLIIPFHGLFKPFSVIERPQWMGPPGPLSKGLVVPGFEFSTLHLAKQTSTT
jgi:hypothetical protein